MPTTKRLTRAERKEQTRTDLIEAARGVFRRRGFHAASLDEIAEEAGYTKGAVYSNFADKDDLFIAVFEAHLQDRARAVVDVVLDEERIEDSYHAVARFIVQADRREPEWAPLLLEFWAHASRKRTLRAAVAERQERFLERIGEVLEELASRHGVGYVIPTTEVARAWGALLRGMSAERFLRPDSDSASEELSEELSATFMASLQRPRDGEALRTADSW
jgi:AcrR family transcriptional regulator